MMAGGLIGRVRSVRSLLGLAAHRVRGRVRTAPQRVALSVLGVAVAIALMVAVTSVALGLASQSVVQDDDVEYWVVPEDSSVQTLAVPSGGVKLGGVHGIAEEIRADERVDGATPVLLTLLPVEDARTGEERYVLAAGVVPDEETELFGLEGGTMTDGDPYYANGSYDGRWTGEAHLNEAAVTLTNASRSDRLAVARSGTNRSFTVTNVSTGEAGMGFGTAPVALVHLSELQTVTGTASSDQADQILVSTTDPSVEGWLQTVYPRTDVVTKRGLSDQQFSVSSLPLAVAVAALLSAVVIGVLFVATLMGLEVSADRRELGTLAAVGFAPRSRSLLVGAETLVVALVGGAVGVAIGVGSIGIVNRVVAAELGVRDIAVFDPLLIGYGLVVAAIVGILGSVYPVYLNRRVDVLEVLSR